MTATTDAAVAGEVFLASDFEAGFDQLAVVRLRHVGEARAEAVVVDADERVVAHEVDVVVDDHDVAAWYMRVHAAARRWRRSAVSQPSAFMTRTGSVILLERVAFVEVEAAFHRHDGHAAEGAADQPARWRVAVDSGSAGCRRRRIAASTSISSTRPPRPVPRMMPACGVAGNWLGWPPRRLRFGRRVRACELTYRLRWGEATKHDCCSGGAEPVLTETVG